MSPSPQELLIIFVAFLLIRAAIRSRRNRIRRKQANNPEQRGSRLDSIVSKTGRMFAMIVGLLICCSLAYQLLSNVNVEINLSDDSRGPVDTQSQEYIAAGQPHIAPDRSANDLPPTKAGRIPIDPSSPEAIPVDDQTLWFPITSETLTELLGPDNAATVAQLRERVPSELQRAYTMIPITADGPQAAPPVIRRVLSPAAIRHIFTPENLQTAAKALATYLPPIEKPKSVASVNDEQTAEAEDVAPGEKRYSAHWIDSPPDGQIVVQSEFLDGSVPPARALQPVVGEAFERHVSQLARQAFGQNSDWQKFVDLKLAEDAVTLCIVATDERVEPVRGVKMQQTAALVSFPDNLETQAMNRIWRGLRRHRTISLCVILGLLWVCAVLFSIVFRSSQHRSLLRKLFTLPLLVVLALPCLAVSMVMVVLLVRGDTFRFEWAAEPVTYTITGTQTSK